MREVLEADRVRDWDDEAEIEEVDPVNDVLDAVETEA